MSSSIQLQTTQVDCHQVFDQIVDRSKRVCPQLTAYGSLRVGDEFLALKGKQEKRVRVARPPQVDRKYDRVVLYLQSSRIETELNSLTRTTFQASRFVEVMPDRQIVTKHQLKQEVVDLIVKNFPPGSKRQHIKEIHEQLQQQSEVRVFRSDIQEACIYLSKRGYMHHRKGTYRPILPPVFGLPVEREYTISVKTCKRVKQKDRRKITKTGWIVGTRVEIPDTFDKRPIFYYTIQFLDGTIVEENEKDLETASSIQTIYGVRVAQARLSGAKSAALTAKYNYSVEKIQSLIDQIHLPNGQLNRSVVAEIGKQIGLKANGEKRQNIVIDFLELNFPNWREKSHNVCRVGAVTSATSSSLPSRVIAGKV